MRKLNGLALALAVIAATAGAVVFVSHRRDIAAYEASRAANEEEAANAKAKGAKALKEAEEAKRASAKLELEREKSRIQAAEAEKDAQAREAENLAVKSRIAEDARREAEAKAKESSDARALAEAKAKEAKALKDAEEAREKTAEAEALTSEHERAKAEAETLKLRHSLAELDALKSEYGARIAEAEALTRDLEEMKEALTPERTISDLMTTGDDLRAEKPAEEDDRNLPAGRRELARAEKTLSALRTEISSATREERIRKLEALMQTAIKADRVVEAQYYYRAIREMYPDWEFTGGEDK